MKSILAGILFSALLCAQVMLGPEQLDQIVSDVALYPDPLLAQVLTASTYSQQIPEAAQWAQKHSYLTGAELAAAITQDNLPWDPSVLALLPFPSVLNQMAGNIFWIRQLGDTVLNQRADVMDAVQAMRQKASDNGYLQDGPQYRVNRAGPGAIEILPVDPAYLYVPAYDPLVVFGRPRVGLSVGLSFGPRIAIGASFAPWGWGRSGFGWSARTIMLDGRPWGRGRENFETYHHAYVAPRPPAGPRVERHDVHTAHSVHRDGRREERR